MNGPSDKSGNKYKRLILGLGIVLFFFMLASLLMMSDALQSPDRFGDYLSGLLLFNTLGLLILVVLITANLINLIKQLKHKVPGSRMTFRTVTMFALLSVTPVLILYYFSLDFLYRGIDSWFDLRVEQALDDSLELSKISLNDRMREILKQTEQVASEIRQKPDSVMPFEIDSYRNRLGAIEVTVMSRQGSFVASSFTDSDNLFPNRPNETILFQLQQGNNYIGLTSVDNSGFSIQAVANIPPSSVNDEPRVIQALFPMAERINALATNIQTAYGKYQELSYLRDQLKLGFVSLLTLVLLFSIFSALWAAFYSANRLAAPIRDLAEGTRSVAEGDYGKQLPVPGNDELGFLVASFNEMTRKISTARDEAKSSQLEAETQKAYLEAVLGRLSSGVLVIDQDNNVRTVNISSSHILGVDIADLSARTLEEIERDFPYLEPLIKTIEYHRADNKGDWREQVTLFGTSGRQILMCSGTVLSVTGGKEFTNVHVTVFDDITALIQGQKNAAWSEMARRLAHEIKNPLTPIQLAAERLRLKYIDTLNPAQSEMLDRLTNTIIQQVETMKDMVNTFSEYAYTPKISQKYIDLNKLIQEVVDLYSTLMNADRTIEMDLAENLPPIKADTGRLRRVFNNLLHNAFDATPGNMHTVIKVKTDFVSNHGLDFVEIRIRDAGAGIPEDLIDRVFEPYVTSKPKGTGLGLAIVQKIIEEHGGIVWLENNENSPGACAIIRLPVVTAIQHTNVNNINQRDII
jgi:nitrogen fixation/metabolism regulation signal transduction histidine kinase